MPRSGPRKVVGLSEIWDVTIVAVFLFLTQKAVPLFHSKLSFCCVGHNCSQAYVCSLIYWISASCLSVLCFHRRLKQRLVWDEGVFAWRLCVQDFAVTSNTARHKRSNQSQVVGWAMPMSVSGDNVSSLRCMELIEALSRPPGTGTLQTWRYDVKINSSKSHLNCCAKFLDFFYRLGSSPSLSGFSSASDPGTWVYLPAALL